MRNRIISFVISLTIILSSSCMAFADADANAVYFGRGDYVYSLTADADTGTVPSGFGTSAYDGKIWTDKSVIANDTDFTVNLKALAQEYVSTASANKTSQTLADVVFILDFTSSMTGTKGKDVIVCDEDGEETSSKEYRIQALIDSFNDAADIIMSANSKNRISVYGFGGRTKTAVATNIMPLGSYTKGTDGNYLILSGSDTVKTSAGMKKDGSTYSQKTQELISYTCSQYGIASAINGLINNINADTSDYSRKPYVIFMTDGAATEATKKYDTKDLSVIKSGELQSSDYTNGSPEQAAATILTACVWKDRLQAAYDDYNAKNGHDKKDLDWFNIGLAINDMNTYARALVDPHILKTDTGDKANDVRSNIENYENNNKVLDTTPDYYDDENYEFYTSDYCYFCDTSAKLDNAFEALAKLVEAESTAINIPIVTNKVSGNISNDMVFTDYIGKGMVASGFTLIINKNTAVVGTDADKDGIYTFEGYKSTVEVSTKGDNQVVKWSLPATELAMFTFKDRKNLTTGGYTAADPSVLSFNVKLKSNVTLEDYPGYSTYTNTSGILEDTRTTAVYSIPGDNIYYFDVTNNNASGDIVFVSSKLKTSVNEYLAKSENITNTYPTVRSYSYTNLNAETIDSVCNTSCEMGNNGKISLVLKSTKTVDKTETVSGTNVTYTTTITNYSDKGHAFELKDKFNTTKTDTSSLTTQTGNVVKSEGSLSTGNVSKTVTVSGDENDIIKGYTPAITKIDDIIINYDTDNQPKVNTNINVKISEPSHAISYAWTGNVPSGKSLPTDTNTYKSGTTFPIETTFASTSENSKVEKKDVYGNVTERWTFSGWTSITRDDNGNTVTGTAMPNSDITIHGIWSYEKPTLQNYSVTYVFDGETPNNNVPTDTNKYVNNQPFSISTASIANVPVYDDYGNVTDIWTFNGWNKVTKGTVEYTGNVIPASNLVVHGTWAKTPQTISQYTVKYEFTGNYPNGVVPTVDSNEYVNNQPFTRTGNYSNIDVKDDYGNVIGTWSFDGWTTAKSDTTGTVLTSDKIPASNVTIYGSWTLTPKAINKYHINYIFDTDAPTSVVLPTDNSEYVNNQSYTVKNGYSDVNIKDVYGNTIATYTWEGWYKTTKEINGSEYSGNVIPGSDITIHGKWKYETKELPKYSITYVFDGESPADAKVAVDSAEYVNNQPFSMADNCESVTIKDIYGNITDIWTFKGWNKITKGTGSDEYLGAVIPNSNLVIHGTWKHEIKKVPTGNVTYEFIGNCPNNVNPPIDDNTYILNQPYTVADKLADVPSYDKYGNQNGTWKFDQWTDTNNGVMVDGGSKITGTWIFVPDDVPQYDVTYSWSGDIPDGFSVPVDSNKYVKEQLYIKDETYYDGYFVETKDVYGNVSGKYIFSGWSDSGNGKMTEGGVTITGNWVYMPITPEKYNVSYSWTGNIPISEILPSDNGQYVKNQPYKTDSKYTNKTVITSTDKYGNINGKYMFSGWTDPGNEKMPEGGVEIIGSWTFTKVEVPSYKIVYSFEGNVPEGVIPPVDDNSYVPGQSYTLPDKASPIEVKDEYGNVIGSYVFDGWEDPNNGKMVVNGCNIVGTWIFIPKKTETLTVVWPVDPQNPEKGSEKIDVVNGAYIIVDPNSGLWEYDGKTINQLTKVTVVKDFTVNNPYREGCVFGGWTVTNENGIYKYTAQWEPARWTVRYTANKESKVPSGTLYIDNGNAIVLDPNGGDVVYNDVEFGSRHITQPITLSINKNTSINNPYRQGYSFDGWEASVDDDGKIWLTAKWQKNDTAEQNDDNCNQDNDNQIVIPETGSYSMFPNTAIFMLIISIAAFVLCFRKNKNEIC